MTPIEILAVLTSIIILGKIVAVIVQPRELFKTINVILKNSKDLIVIFFVTALVALCYLLQELTIVQLAAAMLFSALLTLAMFLTYPKNVNQLIRKSIKKPNWPVLVILTIIALWVLQVVFMFSFICFK